MRVEEVVRGKDGAKAGGSGGLHRASSAAERGMLIAEILRPGAANTQGQDGGRGENEMTAQIFEMFGVLICVRTPRVSRRRWSTEPV